VGCPQYYPPTTKETTKKLPKKKKKKQWHSFLSFACRLTNLVMKNGLSQGGDGGCAMGTGKLNGGGGGGRSGARLGGVYENHPQQKHNVETQLIPQWMCCVQANFRLIVGCHHPSAYAASCSLPLASNEPPGRNWSGLRGRW